MHGLASLGLEVFSTTRPAAYLPRVRAASHSAGRLVLREAAFRSGLLSLTHRSEERAITTSPFLAQPFREVGPPHKPPPSLFHIRRVEWSEVLEVGSFGRNCYDEFGGAHDHMRPLR